MPVIPATWEVEAGESLEPRILALGYRARFHLKNNNKETHTQHTERPASKWVKPTDTDLESYVRNRATHSSASVGKGDKKRDQKPEEWEDRGAGVLPKPCSRDSRVSRWF